MFGLQVTQDQEMLQHQGISGQDARMVAGLSENYVRLKGELPLLIFFANTPPGHVKKAIQGSLDNVI